VKPRSSSSPASARAPVSGSVVSPAPSLAELCAPGYVKKTTAPPSVTDPIKACQLAQGSHPDKDPSHYTEDQLIPVGLGGTPTDERNLWPQRTDLWALKNREENRLRASVCGGHTTLAAAQVEMVQNWDPRPKRGPALAGRPGSVPASPGGHVPDGSRAEVHRTATSESDLAPLG
jgi:hypothetical protein